MIGPSCLETLTPVHLYLFAIFSDGAPQDHLTTEITVNVTKKHQNVRQCTATQATSKSCSVHALLLSVSGVMLIHNRWGTVSAHESQPCIGHCAHAARLISQNNPMLIFMTVDLELRAMRANPKWQKSVCHPSGNFSAIAFKPLLQNVPKCVSSSTHGS
jgi:hypothetical protein